MAVSFRSVIHITFQVMTVLSYKTVELARLPGSPCPNMFTYEKVQNKTGDIIFPGRDNPFWRGVLKIPGHVLLEPGGGIYLKVILAVPAALPTNYVGRIEFQGDKAKLFGGSSTKYDVIFPWNTPIPHLINVRVNNRSLCNGLPPRGPVVTKLILEHSLFPVRVNITSRRGDFMDSDSGKVESKVTCGNFAMGNPFGLAGRSSVVGEWPWLVPIFKTSKDDRGVQFHCAGTLVSSKYLLSAAHCFMGMEDPKIFVAFVGRHNIHEWNEANGQPKEVKSIILHPDFREEYLYSDVTILELSTPVFWSKKVRPICFWDGPEDLDLIVGRKATVVGWGTDEADKTKVTSEPNSIELPVVSQETCLRSSREFYFLTSNRTLCAGSQDGSGPCNGDSGSGLYLPLKDPGGSVRWYFRGIVVGWGTVEANKTKVTPGPNSLELPVASQETCLRSCREFYFMSSNRTLRAGSRDGSGPCNRDSGGVQYLQLKNPDGAALGDTSRVSSAYHFWILKPEDVIFITLQFLLTSLSSGRGYKLSYGAMKLTISIGCDYLPT